jgi:DtxR family transcriptional regulator, Mn-dependent transcriptional regulator
MPKTAAPLDLRTLEDEFLGDEEKPDPSEEYLEALAMLEQLGRERPTVGEVAAKVKVRPPSAVQMLKRLERRGLVDYFEREGVRLTAKGRRIGQRMVRNGRLMEVFIATELGLPKELHVAHAVEHSLSVGFTDALCRRLGHPEACPHGYPIPRGKCCSRTG